MKRTVASWRLGRSGILLSIRLEAVLFFVVLAIMLDTLIMQWALDTHPLVHLHGARDAVRVTLHASALARHLGTVAITVLLILATLAHELGHAFALRRAGATGVVITIYGAGGSCRAEARDTTPLALLWYAAAGPLVTIAIVSGMLIARTIVPWPHGVHAVLWLSAAIQVGILACNVLPVLSRSDGGHMLRALTTLLGTGRISRYSVVLGLALPVFTLGATLQANTLAALFWCAISVVLVATLARIAWDADRRQFDRAGTPRLAGVERTITFW